MRTVLTEDESIRFELSVNEFCEKLAKITAETLASFSPAIEEELVVRLQDHTSLYSPFTHDVMREELARLRETQKDKNK